MLGRVDGVTLSCRWRARRLCAALGSSSPAKQTVFVWSCNGTYEAVLVLVAGDQEVYGALSECGGGVV